MRILRYAVVALLAAALAGTSWGWWHSAHSLGGRRFDSCSYDGSTLTLRYSYGDGELVAPGVDTRDGRLVVGLRRVGTSGAERAIRRPGVATFPVSESGPVTYADGTPLDCPVAHDG